MVASIATIREAPWAGNADYDYISVTCYYRQKSDNSADNSICAGGGDFDRLPSSDARCNLQKDDGATLILDKDKDCYFRKNFGLNGVADARQCGVVGDGQPGGGTLPGGETHPDDAQFLNSCMGLVSQLTTQNLQNSLSIVTTGGGVILDNTTDIKIPLNVTLECGGTFTAASNNDDYRIFKSDGTHNLTGAIVIDPTNHGVPGSPAYYSIKSTGKNATYKDCTVVAGAGARNAVSNMYPNPYSPSVFYPDCAFPYTGFSGVTCTDASTIDETRASTLIQSAFSNPRDTSGVITPGPAAGSTGIVSTAGMNVQNVRVIGFGTCITDNGPKPLTQNVDCDGSTGISIHTSDAPMIENTAINSEITTGEQAFIIPTGGISWDTTHTPNAYQVTANLVSGNAFQFMDGDIVWIAPQPGFGAQSANGYWKIANTTCPTTPIPRCIFNLVGSVQSVTQTANLNANALSPSVLSLTSISPSNISLKFVQIGQTVTDQSNPSCIPGLTTITNVWPARGLVYLSSPVGAGCTGPDTIKFADTDYTMAPPGTCSLTNPGLGGGPPSGSTNGCAIVDPNFRWGDGIYTENSGGARAVNCQIYEHLISWHLYDGTRSAFFSNCATGNANDLPDRNLAALTSTVYPSGNIVSVYIEGSHDHTVPPDDQSNETDACETDWSNMVLGQHRSTNIVVQSDCDTPNRFANVSIGGGSGGIDFEVDAGGLSIVNEAGNSPAVMFKADKTTLYGRDNPALSYSLSANLSLSNNRSTNSNMIFANTNAAATTTGCGNVFLLPPALNCPHTVAIGPTITVAGTIDGSAQLWPCDATAGNVAINVPVGSANPNATFQVKKIDSSTHTCRIVMSGSDTLDGLGTYASVNTQWQSVTFTNIGGSTIWYVTAH